MLDPLLELREPGYALVGIGFAAAYLAGSIPWAYIIVLLVSHEDVTAHGTGNVGAMNVRRTTGSWAWFTVAMVADALKGLLPVLALRLWSADIARPLIALLGASESAGQPLVTPALLPMQAAVLGAVLGHNFSLWMALKNRRFERTGKGLATGGGALIAYDWRYFLIVLTVGLAVIGLTKYMMAGQVAAAWALPAAALALRSPDWPFALLMGGLVYAAHHKRFMGLLRGEEPKLYVEDTHGPRG